MIPILYAASETDFTTNGIGLLTDAVSCTVTELVQYVVRELERQRQQQQREQLYALRARLCYTISHTAAP